MSEKSAFRRCGRDLVEFFNNTGWAFPVKLTPNRPTSGWPVIRDQSHKTQEYHFRDGRPGLRSGLTNI
jgi:hypothetical protein